MNKLYIKFTTKVINLFILLFLVTVMLLKWDIKKKQGYSLFIEFSNAYGIKKGTYIYFRGIQIGYIKNIYIKINSIVVMAHINSIKILIPKNSLIEINQTGLFNDTLIDIIPLEMISNELSNINVFSTSCLNTSILCHYHYLKGYRGLNYDDLVRAATRISQRFDDPRFFNLFYLFLQNNIDISNEILNTLSSTSKIIYIFLYFIKTYLRIYFN
uniref:Mce/MlaD domain-containing protein n=1 Tax=Caloglossa beccarii TaxID=131038 RepID=A0A1Z1M821_9FLOR|nr:hypothetical protein [Caloglossa beccarii]ARW62238.1 hypothetical protein [Caloglossa beccarii]